MPHAAAATPQMLRRVNAQAVLRHIRGADVATGTESSLGRAAIGTAQRRQRLHQRLLETVKLVPALQGSRA